MLVKKICLLSILLCNVLIPNLDISKQYFSSVSKLNELEQQKMKALFSGADQKSGQSSFLDTEQGQEILLKCTMLAASYADLIEPFLEQGQSIDHGRLKHALNGLSDRVKKDSELTSFAKNLIVVVCKHGSLFVDEPAVRSFFEKLHKHETVDLEKIGIEQLCVEYLSTKIDVVQVGYEYIVWAYGHLKKQITLNQKLKIDDVSYVLKEFAVFAKLPKKSKDLWDDLVVAMQHGLNDASPDVRQFVIDQVEQVVRKQELDLGFKLIAGMAKLRQEIIATNGADQGKLIGYGKLLDQMIMQIKKSQNQQIRSKQDTQKSFMILQKLLFKN